MMFVMVRKGDPLAMLSIAEIQINLSGSVSAPVEAEHYRKTKHTRFDIGPT